MPKKPFTPAEVELQQNRIMDGAANVMADVGFHHLSMRTLASRLGMTASNIYNYFPGKESLLLHIRRRGFELVFRHVATLFKGTSGNGYPLGLFVRQLILFDQRYPGYYGLMFQSPSFDDESDEEALVPLMLKVDRLMMEWQQQVIELIMVVVPDLEGCSAEHRRRTVLFFLASVHGLLVGYQCQAFPEVMKEPLSDDTIDDYVDRLLIGLGVTVARQALPGDAVPNETVSGDVLLDSSRALVP